MRLRLLLVIGLLAALAAGGAVAQARGGHKHRRAHHHRVHHHRAHHHRGHHHRPAPAHQTTRPATAPRPVPVPASPPVLPAPVPLPSPPVLGHLQVPEREFSLSLSRPELTAGRTVIEAIDFGEDPHNLQIERVGSTDAPVSFPVLAPGTRATKTVDLQAGTYRLFCSLSGHDALGMHATLIVR
jgi:plastocyanin